jgi:N-glycosylase/DNA lyase
MGAILNAPIIVDAGRISRASVRNLKRGQGKLLDDVKDALDEVNTSLGADAEGKHLIPVVLVYRRRSRSRSGRRSFLPLRIPILG